MYSTAELLQKIDKLVCIYDVWPLFDRYEPERYKDERNLIWSRCSDDCKEEDFEQVYFIFFFINEFSIILEKEGLYKNINASKKYSIMSRI